MKARLSVTKQNNTNSTPDNTLSEAAPLVRSYRVSDVSAVEISDLILPIHHQLEEITIPDHEYLGSTEDIIKKKSVHLRVDPSLINSSKRRKMSTRKSALEICFAPSVIPDSDSDAASAPETLQEKPEKKKRVKFEPLSPIMSPAKKRWISL